MSAELPGCNVCGALMWEPDMHAEWHRNAVASIADLLRPDRARAVVGADGFCNDPGCTCHRVGGL